MNSIWIRTNPNRKMFLWGDTIFPVCCAPLSAFCTQPGSLRWTGSCEWAAGSSADDLISKCLRRTWCRCLLHSDFPNPGHATDSLCHSIFKFFCFQISGLVCTVVWWSGSCSPRGERGETQEKEVYYTHESERRHTTQGHKRKHQGGQEAEYRGQGRVQTSTMTGVSVGKANQGRWRIWD